MLKRSFALLVLASGFSLAVPIAAVAHDVACHTTHGAIATWQSAPGAAAVQAKPSDVVTAQQVKDLIATAKTPADHIKLQKHYLALAAKYEADADEHAAEAVAYRKNPNFLESKNPIGPGTAAHCERFAQLDREAAKEARDLASAHEHMAAVK
jgi:hypothetical protein